MNETKTLMQQLRPEVNAALAPIAKKFGLKSLTLGNGSYSPSGNFTFKLEGTTEGGLNKDAERYTSDSAKFLGLPPLGTTFRNGSKQFATAGLNKSGSKVICAEVGTTKLYVFTPEIVKALVKAQEAQRP